MNRILIGLTVVLSANFAVAQSSPQETQSLAKCVTQSTRFSSTAVRNLQAIANLNAKTADEVINALIGLDDSRLRAANLSKRSAQFELHMVSRLQNSILQQDESGVLRVLEMMPEFYEYLSKLAPEFCKSK